jgi:predicted nucleic acid-binding protein
LNRRLIYLDSSAIVKLVIREAETPALLSFLGDHPERASSALARVEVYRAFRRARASDAEKRRAADVLARIALIRIDDDILQAAAEIEPAQLRSLDAVHLATALLIREEMTALVSYDDRFAAAAKKHGLKVLAPA